MPAVLRGVETKSRSKTSFFYWALFQSFRGEIGRFTRVMDLQCEIRHIEPQIQLSIILILQSSFRTLNMGLGDS